MKALSFQVLFVLWVLCLVTLAGGICHGGRWQPVQGWVAVHTGQPKAPLKCSIECSHFTSPIAAKRIRSYRRTEPRCSKQAIIFTTLKSMEICADPEAEWVKKIVEKLDQKKAAASPLPQDATPAVAPEGPGVFQKHVGLTVTAPSQATAPTSFFQGTSTTVLERIRVPAARTEASSKSPPAMQETTQLPAGLSPVIWEGAARSEVTPEANRDSLKSPAPSTTFAAGMVFSQTTPCPTALVHGFDKAVGSTEEPVGHTANATADVRDSTSPTANSDPIAITEGPEHPVLSPNESLDPKSARANTSHTVSNSFSPDLHSILDSREIATVPATPVPPVTTSVSTLNPTSATGEGPSVRINKVSSSSADAFGTRIVDYLSSIGKQGPSDMLVFTSQTFSGQARTQMTTERPSSLPLPRFLSGSQMHFVIPVSLVGGLMACSVAAVWLYLKFGIKREETSREMIQGLLYQKAADQNNLFPMEVI